MDKHVNVPQCDATGPFGPEGVDDVSDKPGLTPPNSGPNVPQGPQGHIATLPTQVAPSSRPVQSQSFITDCHILRRNQDQDGPPNAGRPPAASGGAQPMGPAVVTDDGGFHSEAFPPQQAMSELGMPTSGPNYEPSDDDNQFVGVMGHQASPSPRPNGNQSPTLSSDSGDSMAAHHDGHAPVPSHTNGRNPRTHHANRAINARNARSTRPTSPQTRVRTVLNMFASQSPQDTATFTAISASPYPHDIDVSGDETDHNP